MFISISQIPPPTIHPLFFYIKWKTNSNYVILTLHLHKHTNFLTIVCSISNMDAPIDIPSNLITHITPPIKEPHVDVKSHVAPQVVDDPTNAKVEVPPWIDNPFDNIKVNIQPPINNPYSNAKVKVLHSVDNLFINVKCEVPPPVDNPFWQCQRKNSSSSW